MSIPILMYHQIDEPPAKGTSLRGLIVSPGSFARQMQMLRWFGYQGLSMRELVPYLSGRKHGKVVGITFDDGYQNNRTHALPVLQQHGFTATCYGVSAAMGGTNAWDASIGIAQKPLMNLDDWQHWSRAGMEVGSHTRNHIDLTQVPDSVALEEVSKSRLDLQQAIGVEVSHFCYPYGRYADRHAQMAREAGYLTATTTRRGRAKASHNAFELPRIMIARATHLGLFAAKIMTAYEDRRG